MHELQARALPRLMIDTIHCLWLAHDQLDNELRDATRQRIAELRETNTMDAKRAGLALRNATPHLVAVEKSLEAAECPFTAGKVRQVRRRVEYVAQA